MIKGILWLIRGGIYVLIVISNLNAIELSTLCGKILGDCEITTQQSKITNHSTYTGEIRIKAQIDTFINYGIVNMPTASIFQTFSLTQSNSYIEHFINYGTFGNLDKMGFWVSNAKGIAHITNYGIMLRHYGLD